jgi:hypothetical protein
MKTLDSQYVETLDGIAQEIQDSDLLQQFLESEEEDDFKLLCDLFEPQIMEVFHEVASDNPQQLVAMETYLLQEKFEGLFLPKILGYSVLRGEIDSNYKYTRPQTHFKDILIAICESANFDFIKRRIGQTLQIGFALSSDIWITNMIDTIDNKKVRYFLQSLKSEKFRLDTERAIGYQKYKRQFVNENYFSADFPQNLSELKVEFGSLRSFIQERIRRKMNNDNLIGEFHAFLNLKDFVGHPERVEMFAYYANFFDLMDAEKANLFKIFNETRKKDPQFAIQFLQVISDLYQAGLPIDQAADKRVSSIVDDKISDQLSEFYSLTDMIHTKGYMNNDVMDSVRVAYNKHEGLSIFNECVRLVILGYIRRFLKNIGESDYHDYFELSRIFAVYMNMFSNEHFNQSVEKLSRSYVDKLLRRFSDKRGRDYQDIKRFVSSTFVEVGFLKEKEVVEIFKTRRKPV